MITIYGKDGEQIYSAKFDEAFIENLDSDAKKELAKTVMDAMVEREKCIQEAKVNMSHHQTEANVNISRLRTEASVTISRQRGEHRNELITHVVDSALPVINGWVCRYGGAVRRTPCDPDIEEEMMNELDLFPPDE